MRRRERLREKSPGGFCIAGRLGTSPAHVPGCEVTTRRHTASHDTTHDAFMTPPLYTRYQDRLVVRNEPVKPLESEQRVYI